MNAKSQMLAAWCGILCPMLMFGGLIAAGFFPPMTPNMTAEQVAAFYQQHGNGVRFGMIWVQISGAMYAVFASGISAQMRRIEHRAAPVLSYAQLALGAATVLAFVVPALVWIAASFRPERSPEVTQTLNDVAWLIFVGVWAIGAVENLIIGFLIIADKKSQPVFPRWIGFLNIWIALLFIPASIMPFFKTGPFAWDGLLAFWIPATVFGIWFFAMAIYLMKAVKQQALEPQ
jgi:hypothetical protein